ncbi:P-loop NTPase [Haloplanus halophilus]|uniref:P-loop NTPase n=1 Tax=Haloplanus halophilus TaxID=2949993 RepID=UPI00203DD4B2|nr:P-loop NTPase [Haloplanus sp. GDY1]
MSRVYAVASGKGGVGKTTTVANLGAVLAEAGHETVAVDVDLGMGNLAGVLGVDVDAGPTVNDVLAGTATITAAVREGPVGLSVLPASTDLDDFGRGDPDGLSTLLDGLDADVVLLDTSAGLSHDSVEPLRVADEVILVSTAEPGALGDTAKTREVADRFGTPVWGAVVTRATTDGDGERAADRSRTDGVAAVADRLGVTVRGSIPEDPAVAAAAAAGDPLVVAAPDAPATGAYRRLAAELLDDDALAPTADEPTADEPTHDADGVVVADAEETARESAEATETEEGTPDDGSVTLDDADDGTDDDTDDDTEADREDEAGSERSGFLRWLLG